MYVQYAVDRTILFFPVFSQFYIHLILHIISLPTFYRVVYCLGKNDGEFAYVFLLTVGQGRNDE